MQVVERKMEEAALLVRDIGAEVLAAEDVPASS